MCRVPGSNLVAHMNRAINDRPEHTAGGHLLSMVPAANLVAHMNRAINDLLLLLLVCVSLTIINDRPEHTAGGHLLSMVPAATNTERL